MVCPSCGHNNADQGAPFCTECGKPLSFESPRAAQLPLATPAKLAPDGARKPAKWMVIAAGCAVCLALAAVGLMILRRVRPGVPTASTPGAEAKNAVAAAANPAPVPPPAASANAAPAAPGAVIPPGTDVAASDFGGEIESVSGAYGGPGLQGEALINAAWQSPWTPDNLASPPDGQQDNPVTYPQEIIFSFYKRDTALVAAVVLQNTADSPGPNAVEIWTSTESPTTGFKQAGAAQFADNTAPAQTISFAPVVARFVKVRLVSGPTDNLELRRIRIIEGSQPGYSSLLARHPDLAQWKTSVRHAAQRGIDWLEPYSMDWQVHRKCFGCHVQAQTMMGLAIAQTNNYLVSSDTLHNLGVTTAAFQVADGHEKYDGYDTVTTPTHFAAMGMAYYDEANSIKDDAVLKRYADWMTRKMSLTGEFPQDMEYVPIAQGTINSTANAVAGFMEVYAQTGNTKYRAQAERGLNFIAAATPDTMQDKVFKVIALARYGNAAQRDLAARAVENIKKEQNADGGWCPTTDTHSSDAFATGQVLYAFKEAGVNIESPEFNRGVRYLIATQSTSGSWGGDGDQSSLFAPTMWAVIGLAGTIEPPSADELKDKLDKSGRVALYINFDFDKATIRPDGKPIVAQVVKLMTAYPDLNLSINGHTDNVGVRSYNLKLSQERAAAVMAAVVANGIAPGRMTSGGSGPDDPIADNNTEKGRAKNRRVELVKR